MKASIEAEDPYYNIAMEAESYIESPSISSSSLLSLSSSIAKDSSRLDPSYMKEDENRNSGNVRYS